MNVFDRLRPTSVAVAAIILSAGLIGCPQDERHDWGVSDDAGGGDAVGDTDASSDTDTADEGAPTCWIEANEGKAEQCEYSDDEESDVDKLTDEEEASLCTDPSDDDTDDDGLMDCRDLRLGLDPCAADTDGDGYDDNAEAELCLDPTDPTRPTERQEWIFSACETASPDLVDTEVSENGLWRYVTGRWTENFSNASYDGDESRPSLATFEMSEIDGQGAVVSFPIQDFGMSDSLEGVLANWVESRLREVGEVEAVREGEVLPRESQYIDSKWEEFEVRPPASAPMSVVRDDAAMAVTGLDNEQFSGWPGQSDAAAGRFMVAVGLSVAHQDRCMPRESGKRTGFAVIVVTSTDLDERARSIRRIVSSPRRLNWGGARTHRDCRRYPLADVSRASGEAEGDADNLVLELDEWIPGTATVRAGGEEVSFGAASGYGYDATRQDLVLSPEAIPDDLPRTNFRFASVRKHDWWLSCRGPCWRSHYSCWESR